MTPAREAESRARSGATLIALLSAGITIVFGYTFFGLSSFRWPFFAILALGAATAALYAFLMWRIVVSERGPLVTGGLAPLIGLFVMDILQSVHAGSGDGYAGSVLFEYWQIGMAAVAAGVLAAILTSAVTRRPVKPDTTN